MAELLSPRELLDLARAEIEPTDADRMRIEHALAGRLDALDGSDASTDGSPDGLDGAVDGAGGLDVATQGGWLSGVGVKIGSAVVVVAAASAWWLAGSSTEPRVIEPARNARPPAVEAPAAAQPTASVAGPHPTAREVGAPAVDEEAPEVERSEALAVNEPAVLVVRDAPAVAGQERSRQELPRAAKGPSATRARTKASSRASGRPTAVSKVASAVNEAPSQATTEEPQARAEEPSIEPKPRPDLLMAELTLIDEASRALGAGRAAQALDALERHRVLYGDGKLLVEREGMTALALCALGRVDAARSHVARFLRRHPSSPLAGRVRAAADCSTER